MLTKSLQTFLVAKPSCKNILAQALLTSPNATRMFCTRHIQDFRKPQFRKPSPKFKSKDDDRAAQQSMKKTASPSFRKNINKYKSQDNEGASPRMPRSVDRSSIEEFSSSAVPFDIFTRDIFNKPKEEVIEELEIAQDDEEQSGANRFPWNFEGAVEKPPVGDIEVLTGLTRVMDEEVVIKLVEDYVKALQGYDLKRLEELLEPLFFKNLSKQLEQMNQKGFKIITEQVPSIEPSVELFKTTNMFCAGVSPNRKKNKSENAYYIFDKALEGVPTRHIIKKHLDGKEMAVVRAVLDLSIKTPIKLKVVDKDGKVVEEEREGEVQYHHIRIENDLLEVSYRSLKRSMNSEQELQTGSNKSFQHVFSHDKWRIIDFDNYMLGNEIVQPRKRLF